MARITGKTLPQKKQAILYILSAAFFFALMNLFVKTAGDLPVWQKAMFRNLVALFIALGVVLREHTSLILKKGAGQWPALITRCVAGSLGVFCNFYAIGRLNIADASMLNKLSPFFAILFSIAVLREKPSRREWAMVFLAFGGALFVIKPSFNMACVPAVIGLISGMGAGLAYTCVRKLGIQGVKGPVIVFYFSLFSCLASIPGMVLTYQPMSAWQLISLLLAGASAAGGQFSITAAYSRAPAKELSVFDYTQVIFAALMSLGILGDFPDGWSLVGYAIIIGTAVYKWKSDQ